MLLRIASTVSLGRINSVKNLYSWLVSKWSKVTKISNMCKVLSSSKVLEEPKCQEKKCVKSPEIQLEHPLAAFCTCLITYSNNCLDIVCLKNH